MRQVDILLVIRMIELMSVISLYSSFYQVCGVCAAHESGELELVSCREKDARTQPISLQPNSNGGLALARVWEVASQVVFK